jgi:hypothetical protein
MRLRLGRAVCLLRWSERQARAVTPGGPPEDAPARGDQHPARSGDRKGPQLHLLAQARRPRPCTPQTCDWRCRACRVHGRPFYSHGDPAVPGARHRAAGGGAGPAVVGQGDGQAPYCPGWGVAMAVTAGGRRRGEQLGWRHAVMDRLPGPAGPTVGGDGWSRPAPVGDLVQPDPDRRASELAPVSPCAAGTP